MLPHYTLLRHARRPVAALSAILLLLVLSIQCTRPDRTAGGNSPPPPAHWPTARWQTSTPEEQGMDSALLAAMLERVEADQIELHSLLIVRHGCLVLEVYFHPYTRDTPHPLASVTKTVIGMLVGIAADQGDIQGAEQPLLSFFPNRTIANRDVYKEAITIEHLLTMQPGLQCDDAPGAAGERMEQSADWVQFMLDRPMAEAPGTRFNYCTGASHLLSAVLQEATGMNARQLANEQLFQPLGIAAVPPARWDVDPQGITNGGYGLLLRPCDLAKLGLLYLQGGRWEDRAIVPASWVTASTAQHAAKEDGSGYGYLWTVYPDQGFYAALGLGGQFLVVLPAQDMVVVFTAAVNNIGYNSVGETQLFGLLRDYIVPAVQADTTLPANPDSVGQLEALVRAAADPQEPVPPLPEAAWQISGRTLALESNPLGWRSIVVRFVEGGAEAYIAVDDGEELAIGLDHRYRHATGEPLLLRGRWESPDTFMVEEIILDQIGRFEFRMTVDEAGADCALVDGVFGGEPIRFAAQLTD